MVDYAVQKVFLCLASGKGSEEWGYVDKSAWKKTCKTGKSQSPIDLDISQAVLVDWEPLKFHNYDARGDIVAENNGHTGGNLKGRYNLQQFHFHWDGNDRFGSEHTLAGLHYPLEVHFVHIKEGLNNTNAHLGASPWQVAVQFQIAPKGDALFDLEKGKEATNSSDTKGDLPSYSPGSLLPPDTSTFFRYTGSLTTPPCSEGVIWTILAHPNLVTDTQLRILRRHLREDGSLLIDNWRTVQPMNGRKLYLNKGTV
ncbi:carbonate dehydratase, eukaryotic-type [Ancylostoma ceylanicum]|uniref:Carbonic anhydrase n=1 Tax=Ancylostoma ceylanicum TaxID=53326 RepID=A0A0D6LSW6_9BILA|nr:carbonate dehydratase, eukaryotic-type [Ancylostoma ceylanicum]